MGPIGQDSESDLAEQWFREFVESNPDWTQESVVAAFLGSTPVNIRERVQEKIQKFLYLRGVFYGKRESIGPGQVIGGYRLVRFLAQGSMGAVWEAEQLSMGRRVALKILHPWLCLRKDFLHRFHLESKSIAKISHPNLVTLIEAGEDDGIFFIAEELVDGASSLADWIFKSQGDGSYSPGYFDQVCRLVVEICEALGAVHQHGLVHSDLKPNNVLLTASGHIKVIDFGLALPQSSLGPDLGFAGGTPNYMSPEQALKGRELPPDERSDVFSLGVILFEMLSFRRPFRGRDRESLRQALQTFTPPDPRRIEPEIPWELAAICQRALEAKPEDRYPSMDAFRKDLQRYLNHEPIQARLPSLRRLGLLWIKRHPFASGIMAAGVVGLMVSLTLLLFVLQEKEETELALTQVTAEQKRVKEERARAEEQKVLAQENARQAIEEAEAGVQILYFLAQSLSDWERRNSVSGDEIFDGDLEPFFAEMGQLDSHEANALVKLGWFFREIGSLEDSRQALEQAVSFYQENPGDWGAVDDIAYFQLAEIYYDFSMLDQAEQNYRRAIELAEKEENPATTGYRRSLGDLLVQKGKLAEAEILIRQVIRDLKENHPDQIRELLLARGSLVNALIGLRRNQEAREECQDLVAKRRAGPGADVKELMTQLMLLADLEMKAGKFANAGVALREAVQIGKEHYPPFARKSLQAESKLCQLLLQEGKYQDCLEQCTELIKKCEGRPGLEAIEEMVQLYAGISLLHLGDHAEAELRFRRVLDSAGRLYPENHSNIGAAHYFLADCLFGAGKYQDAVPHFQRNAEILEKCHGAEDDRTIRAKRRLQACHEAIEIARKD
ncbi:MAG: hypothetical protein DWQ01_00090 [Planctomycetota bacterium]|nr:MAG: hypothetical protein DWQ01_00090 [Planctomycetota bacterium]